VQSHNVAVVQDVIGQCRQQHLEFHSITI